MPSGPVIGLGVTPSTVPAARAQPGRDFVADPLVHRRVAHHPALADLAAPGLELRLDQGDQPAAGPGEVERLVEHLGERDEARVADDEVDRLGDDLRR